MLLMAASRQVIDDLHQDLARAGFANARPIHGFALQAIGRTGASQTGIGARLGVSKQAAGQTIANLVSLGYAVRERDPADGRALIVRRSERGNELLASSARFLVQREAEWEQQFGAEPMREFSRILLSLAGNANIGDFPGWVSQEIVEDPIQ